MSLAGIATARTPVDPSTLNPAPPDFFNAECAALGNGIVCTLAFVDPEVIVDEPSGIVCDGVEILFSQDRWVVGKRVYDASGNLLQRHFRETMVGTLDNPETGRSIDFIQHDTVIHDLATPGDVDSGTTRISGLAFRASRPDGTTVQVGAGTLLLDAAGDIVHDGGPHPLDDYFYYGDPDALAPVCAALS